MAYQKKNWSGEGGMLSQSIEDNIKEYQQTRSPKRFAKLLMMLDKLIIRMIHHERTEHPELKKINIQDLYHECIICLHKASINFDFTKGKLYMFPRYLQGYIRTTCIQLVGKERRYVSAGLIINTEDGDEQFLLRRNDDGDARKSAAQYTLILDIVEAYIAQGKLQPWARDVIKLRFQNGLTNNEIAKLARISVRTVRWRCQHVIVTIRPAALRMLKQANYGKVIQLVK